MSKDRADRRTTGDERSYSMPSLGERLARAAVADRQWPRAD
jgi:hypothetical protein